MVLFSSPSRFLSAVPRAYPWKVYILGLGFLALIFLGLFSRAAVQGRMEKKRAVLPADPASDIQFIPEAERPLDVCVIGLEPNQRSYFLLPTVEKSDSRNGDQQKEIRRQNYWLNFEMSHGRVLNALPPWTEIYVAVPDSQSTADSYGGEEELFREYLRNRCAWSRDQIKRRIHFFKSPSSLVWSQDVGKILGKDAKGRWVIYVCPNDTGSYLEAVASLCGAYPDKFSSVNLPQGTSAEGGDEDLVRAPGGGLLYLVGRHRITRYLQWLNGFAWIGVEGSPTFDDALTSGQIKTAEEAFEKAFQPLPVKVIPTRPLRKPALGSNEVFHLDMALAVAGPPGGETAFVPTYLPNAMDRLSGGLLPEDFVEKLQSEFDFVASEMESLGFPVVRLPLADHPVRSPVNFVRYYDVQAKQGVVLLSKYPFHLNGPYSQTSQGELMTRLNQLRNDTALWENTPDARYFRQVLASIQRVWDQLDFIASEKNPIFEETVKKIEKTGLKVVPVPDYPWGSGGLHCETLH